MFVFFAPNAGALLGVPYPALAAWIGRSKPLAGDDLSRLLRSLPLTGLGGPVGVCLVLPFMFHCTRLDGDGYATMPFTADAMVPMMPGDASLSPPPTVLTMECGDVNFSLAAPPTARCARKEAPLM